MPLGQPDCHGNAADHCCYWNGEPCPYLEETTVPGRRWACGLFREIGNWDAVHTDPRYLADVQPLWRGSGELWEWFWSRGLRCGHWGIIDGPQGMAQKLRTRGNDEQWKADFVNKILDDAERVRQGEVVPYLCCMGNAPEVT
jgi:hypothetical protein